MGSDPQLTPPKWLYFRRKLFRFHAVAQVVARRPGVRTMLDLGCGNGEYLLRFGHLPLRRVGLDISLRRLVQARRQRLDVAQSSGLHLPFADGAFDMIYVAHVLHHVADFEQVLREIRRCLAPDGILFLVETTTDNPLLRLGRRLHPVWQGDRVEASWHFAELQQILERAGFVSEQYGRYNLVFLVWEMLPLALWPMEVLTPLFVYLDLFLARFWSRYAAHCYFLLRQKR